MGAVNKDINVIQGKTFSASFGWAQGKFVWRAITGVTNEAPVSLTILGHDLKDGWPYWISCLKKPAGLNNWPESGHGCQPQDPGDPYVAEVSDADTLTINHINGLCLDAYAGGGVIKYYARADIAGYSARLQVRRSVRDAAILYEASSDDMGSGLVVDEETSTFVLSIPAGAFDSATFAAAIYEIEIEAPTGERYQLAYGAFTLTAELVK